MGKTLNALKFLRYEALPLSAAYFFLGLSVPQITSERGYLACTTSNPNTGVLSTLDGGLLMYISDTKLQALEQSYDVYGERETKYFYGWDKSKVHTFDGDLIADDLSWQSISKNSYVRYERIANPLLPFFWNDRIRNIDLIENGDTAEFAYHFKKSKSAIVTKD